jgi:aryl sulfotransferase
MRATGGPPPLPEDPDEFFRLWLSNGSFEWESDGAPYWSVFRHGASFWAHREAPNIHLTHYADLKADREGEMRRIAGLLGIEVAEARWPELVKAAGFESMKKNADRTAPDTDMQMWKDNARFFNKGTSGQWQGVLSAQSMSLLEQVKVRYPADYIDWLFGGAG